ncbi:MAG TPA: DUF6728 family protein [Cyclobacteriaceae bacterium]|nr:DUF6728 family protein [Cyclobacteriaceae bacterium]
MDENKMNPAPKSKNRIKEFFQLNEVLGYFFRGKDASRPNNINIRMMHGINKISIIIFLAGVIYLIFKLVIKPSL